MNGTVASDDIRLNLDAQGPYVDWFVYNGGNPIQIGQLAVADAAGLTINGNGGNDTLLLDNTIGNPLPNNLHLNGTFTINGLASNPATLANTTLEIGNSTLYFTYTPGQSPAAIVQQALLQGYNNGTWTGTPTASTGAILSTSAAGGPTNMYGIGYVDSADNLIPGQPANTVEVRYTVMGDTNLDRVVNYDDALRMQAHFNAINSPAWDQGNFTYDATINAVDAIMLARNYNLTASGAAEAAVVAATSAESSAGTNSSSGGSAGGLAPVISPAPVTEPAPVATVAMPTAPTTTPTAPVTTPIAPTTSSTATVAPSVPPTVAAVSPVQPSTLTPVQRAPTPVIPPQAAPTASPPVVTATASVVPTTTVAPSAHPVVATRTVGPVVTINVLPTSSHDGERIDRRPRRDRRFGR